jgi:hypothetical protein
MKKKKNTVGKDTERNDNLEFQPQKIYQYALVDFHLHLHQPACLIEVLHITILPFV